ncbi:MAG: cytochrome c-type biogenesis protein CcmH [Armatimonadota bacterium]|nr:cytochrome c-type biogenesis protein CcmH [Armatimonadota bacterium]MDW8156472.1 cytochrome c-type biogenesis protein CcmH [Armatimonadota bacterium]
MRAALLAAAVAALCTAAWGSPDLDQRVRAVASQLMCPVCEGRTVADSTSELAAQMRAVIRQRLAQGESEEAVLRYFVDRYGPSVLASPQPAGPGLVLWLAPALLAAGGAGYVVYRFGRRSPWTGSEDGEEDS